MLASRGLSRLLGSALLLACNGKSLDAQNGGGMGAGAGGVGGATNQLDLGAGSAGSGAESGSRAACPECPAALDVQLCCAEVCGYLNTESGECVPSIAGSQVLPIVAAPDGVLCGARWMCANGEGCPTQLPAEGSACREDVHCNYCVPRAIPRMMRCLEGAWVTIGPNPPCGYVIDPVR